MTITALALVLAASPVQSGDLATVLLREGDTLTGGSQPYVVQGLSSYIQGGVDGGWVTTSRVRELNANITYHPLIGQWPNQVGGPVQVLREAQVIQGYRQRFLGPASMANGQMAYIADTPPANTDPQTVWLDDQLLVSAGDPAPFTDYPYFWRAFYGVHLATNGSVFVRGLATTATGSFGRDALVEITNQTVLVATDSLIPGYVYPVRHVIGRWSVSPDGQHWAAQIQFDSLFRNALIVDGEVLRLGSGARALEGGPVPPEIQSGSTFTTWDQFYGIEVNNDGEVTFEAATGDRTLIVRNGAPIFETSGASRRTLIGMDERGYVLSHEASTNRSFVEREPVFDANAAVDVDGDGQPDPDWSIASTEYNGWVRPGPGALTVFTGELGNTGTPLTFSAILQARNHRIDQSTCSGVPNSSGIGADLVVSGDARASANEITLQAYDLARFSFGYFLVSRTAGYVANPGGSQGDLCLGGDIGRLNQQIFNTSARGIGRATIDLTSIPQPMGTAIAAPGDSWYVQAWYRDAIQSGATTNFSGASLIRLQ